MKINITKIPAIALVLCMTASTLSGCMSKKDEIENVQIALWTDERNLSILQQELDAFQEMYPEVNFNFNISMEGEDTCKETVLASPQNAADIYTFADDQMDELYLGGALLEITENTDEVLSKIGGKDTESAHAAMRNNKLYAYPETAGNGYFLYYNKEYFSENDIDKLDTILEICEKNNKKFTMDYSSGWYIYSFFKGAGLELYCNDDGTANICSWNSTDSEYKGVDVAEAMLDIAKHDGFISLSDDEFLEGVKSGEIIAGVNGAWNSETVSAEWGENYGAAKLPTYTINDTQVQMCSFTGFKLVGINAYTENPEWCMKLAEYITNEENQLKRFEATGECPVNINAAKSDKVLASPAVAALAEQSPFSYIQSIADPFWQASSKLGVSLSAGNLDERDLQEMLDRTVEEITAVSELTKGD